MRHFPVTFVLLRILAMCIYIYVYGTAAATKTEMMIII